MVSFRRSYWLSITYFILLHVFSFILSFFFLFSLFFFNVTGLVEPTESRSVYEKSQFHLTSTCLSEFLATEYLHETNKAIFMLCFIYGFLFFRCLEKVFGFQRKKNKNREGNIGCVSTSWLPQREIGLMGISFHR